MLCDYVETALTAHQIGDLLTMAGFELEGIEEHGDEHVLDIKVMSNRGDGLSVFGLAREVLAKDQASNPTRLYTRAASRFEDIAIAETIQIPTETVRIESESCRRMTARAFANVNAKTESPKWMQKRLDACGMRPISLLVDLTNYVIGITNSWVRFDAKGTKKDSGIDGYDYRKSTVPGMELTNGARIVGLLSTPKFTYTVPPVEAGFYSNHVVAYMRAMTDSANPGAEMTAYLEPFEVGDVLPDMPVYLEPDDYVELNLEKTYLDTFAATPKRWRDELE